MMPQGVWKSAYREDQPDLFFLLQVVPTVSHQCDPSKVASTRETLTILNFLCKDFPTFSYFLLRFSDLLPMGQQPLQAQDLGVEL